MTKKGKENALLLLPDTAENSGALKRSFKSSSFNKYIFIFCLLLACTRLHYVYELTIRFSGLKKATDLRRSVKYMNWDIDPPTKAAASNYPVQIAAVIPADQFPGRTFNAANWSHRMLPGDHWPQGAIVSSPEQIILTFQRQQYLQALALVVSWGTMWRRAGAIYGNHSLLSIHNTLAQCAESILATQSIAQAWMLLTQNLGWSAVISSKTLHFLCRALGFNQDPPVAIDNKVIRNRVWPVFCNGIPVGQRPQNWRGDTFDAYSRYMTAILEWAQVRNWTTTQLEVTLFDEYK